MNPAISIVIPSFCGGQRGGLGSLRLALEAWSRQTLAPERFEIVLVDDGSEVDLAECVGRWPLRPRVRTLRNDDKGMCSAYNYGVTRAEADLVLLGVDDSLPAPGLLTSHLALHDGASDPVVVCGRERHILRGSVTHGEGGSDPRVTVEDSAAPTAPLGLSQVRDDFEAYERAAPITAAYRDIEAVLTTGSEYASVAPWLVMRVANHSLSRRLYLDIGGADPRFDPHGWYMDIELGVRLADAGCRFVHSPEPMINLPHPRSEQRLEREPDAFAHLLEKHFTLSVAMLPVFFKLAPELTIDQYCMLVSALEHRTAAEGASAAPEPMEEATT